jgi:hypothetical protein
MEKTAHDLPPPLEAEPVQLRGGGTIIRVKRKRNEQPLDALGMNPSLISHLIAIAQTLELET